MACYCNEEQRQGCTFAEPKLEETKDFADGNPPYLPQPEDRKVENELSTEPTPMDPVGPWATGRVDWSPLAGVTGTRPVVDRYTISRFSPLEWRKMNQDLINASRLKQGHGHIVRCAIQKTADDLDKAQKETTDRLRQKNRNIYKWRAEAETVIVQLREEIPHLMDMKLRLKRAMCTLLIPEAICGECIEIRTRRLEPDLVRDEVEEGLISERALCHEIREVWNAAIEELDRTINATQEAKKRLEFDWSDKTENFNIETTNINLKNESPSILFKPGAVRMPENQSTDQHWQYYTEENLSMARAALKNAQIVREKTNDSIITNSIRDLQQQSDKISLALSKRVSETSQCKAHLENELEKVLKQIADMEKINEDLQMMIRETDFSLKVAQTRLDNRHQRPRVENTRDAIQSGLIDEVSTIMKNVAGLKVQIEETNKTLNHLRLTRANLERQIITKRRTLAIDVGRVQEIRSRYPDSTTLAGH